MDNKFNLNLINTLILLKKHGNMRVVSKISGKSESAISKELARLQEDFSDRLFIKTQHGFEATYYLSQIYDDIESAYEQLLSVMSRPINFNPIEYQNLITIAIAEPEYNNISFYLHRKLADTFPRAKINFITWNKDSLAQLLTGNIDCAVHLKNNFLSKDIYQKPLFKDKIVIAINKQHQIKTWNEINKVPFIFIDLQGWNELNYRFKEILPKKHKSDITYQIRVDQIKSALQIASQGKYAIQVPTKFLNDEFSIIPYPNDIDFFITYSFYCLQTNRKNPLIQHIVDLIADYYSDCN